MEFQNKSYFNSIFTSIIFVTYVSIHTVSLRILYYTLFCYLVLVQFFVRLRIVTCVHTSTLENNIMMRPFFFIQILFSFFLSDFFQDMSFFYIRNVLRYLVGNYQKLNFSFFLSIIFEFRLNSGNVNISRFCN